MNRLRCTHTPLPADSADRMALLRNTDVPRNGLLVWFLGQNGFVLKTSGGALIAIDPYLSDSVAEENPSHPLDLRRTFPAPIAAEHLTVDTVIFTHSHGDHLDLQTLACLPGAPAFLAPWDAEQRLLHAGYDAGRIFLLHPNQEVTVDGVNVKGIFAFPTDTTDLNHIGVLIQPNAGPSFYNTGDTAYAEHLKKLLPAEVDLCAICINGGFHNLTHAEAARIIETITPDTVIPTHYDLMACNQSDPEMFRVALQTSSISSRYCHLSTDHMYLFEKDVA